MNNLPKVVTQRCPEYKDLNPRPTGSKSNALPVALPRYLDTPLEEVNSTRRQITVGLQCDIVQCAKILISHWLGFVHCL